MCCAEKFLYELCLFACVFVYFLCYVRVRVFLFVCISVFVCVLICANGYVCVCGSLGTLPHVHTESHALYLIRALNIQLFWSIALSIDSYILTFNILILTMRYIALYIEPHNNCVKIITIVLIK